MAHDIKQFPIKPSVIITIFKGNRNYSLSKDGTILFDGKYVENDFSRNQYDFRYHELFEVGKDSTEKKLNSFFKQNKIESEFDNDSSEEILFRFLEKQGYNISLKKSENLYGVNERLFVVIPKSYKKAKGSSFKNIFNICSESFKYGDDIDIELDVFMTPITANVKNIIFRVDIPDYIYNKCLENNNVAIQPKLKYIESNSLSTLHSKMSEYSSMAVSVYQEQKSSEKYIKKIVIDFSSHETSERDSFNFAYTGQRIFTKFNWYIVYEYSSNGLMGGKSYFTFLKKESNFSSVKPTHGLTKDENGLIDLSKVNGKCYLQSKPSGVIIDWTQERENFFNEIENNFRKLSMNLNHFLSDLDSEKVDLLINNSNFKFLN
jgi:hypothetical protein